MIILIFAGIISCKKDRLPVAALALTPSSGTRTQLTLDSIYLYASQIYLWYNSLPSYSVFDPRTKYADVANDVDAFDKELFDIIQTAINPQSGKPYEVSEYAGTPKYSFIEQMTQNGKSLAVTSSSMLPAVLNDTILDCDGQSVAYIALGSFPQLKDCKSALKNAFDELSLIKPKDIIVDLRSNGGGYVETAQYVANLIAPQGLSTKIMFSESYNDLLKNGQAAILQYQPYLDDDGNPVLYKGRNATMADVDYSETGNTFRFEKTSGLSAIQHIYFIVSDKTASASELLISLFKPYLKETIIGETTYGKPVGFFPVNIDIYSLYLSAFLIKNADGWSDYFDGIPADIQTSVDLNPDWGNPQDVAIRAALNAIVGKNISSVNNHGLKKDKIIQRQNLSNVFKGTIESRFHLK